MLLTDEELQKRFTYHLPKPEQARRHESIRDMARGMANLILALTPAETREQALALTHLEETVFWANAAIVRQP